MAHRRILSLWFPRLAAERHLRRIGDALPVPLAVVGERRGAQVLTSLSAAAEQAGLTRGQPLRDATAMCPGLVTRAEDALSEAGFLTVLRRWAGKFSPWVAEEPPESLVIDLTGCAHLFGGEAALLAQVEADCATLGLSLRAGIADTRGAAWALARYAGAEAPAVRSGDAVEQEARATRSRATRRRAPDRAPAAAAEGVPQGVIAPPGHGLRALAALPVAALRLDAATVEGLARLGLRRVADLAGLPRAALARRFGTGTLRRLDQAQRVEPEPVSPARAPLHFAVRLTLPEPIGLVADVQAAVDRLLPALCDRLRAQGRGARRVRLEAFRADGGVARAEVGLARPADAPEAIRPLLALKLDALEAGFGFDAIRLVAPQTEPRHATGHRGAAEVAGDALAGLIGRLGARLGTEAVTRLHPADSHLPEKAATRHMAAWSDPAPAAWPRPPAPRPLLIFRPEPVTPLEGGAGADLPAVFRWRRRDWQVARARGPERLAPEWWLDDPAWRSGPRDYWRVETATGERLWLAYAHGGDIPGGWLCQGVFA